MAAKKTPTTQALRALDAAGVKYLLHSYRYLDHGGTAEAARQLGADEHRVIKTLIMADLGGEALVIMMHGDRNVSTKALARAAGVKAVNPVDPKDALRLTGYQVGGISPFGQRKKLPVYAEASILELESIIINAGRRGLLVEMATEDLKRVLSPIAVNVAT